MKTPIALETTGNGTARLTLGCLSLPITGWHKAGDGRGEGVVHLPTDDPRWPDWVKALLPLVRA